MSEVEVERLDVIAIGPHPDDLEITCGGTLAIETGNANFDHAHGEPPGVVDSIRRLP